MRSKVFLLVFAILIGFVLMAGQVSTSMAQNQSSDTSKSSTQNDKKKKNMNQKRKDQADKIITDMTDKGASQSDIQAQKNANKKYYGHEGEFRE
jgi:outer membrane murein-binding lipoprotein Lpp